MAVEGFLGRWSRRKREAERGVEQRTEHDVDREVHGEPPAQEPPARHADSFQSPAALRNDVGATVAGQDRHAGSDAGSTDREASDRTADAGAGAATTPAARAADAAVQAPQAAPVQGGAGSLADALPDIATLTGDSDFSPFMRPGVDPQLRVAALKKLFADPRFNRMDGLDVYIDDYGKPDPLPAGMLRRLEQGRSLGLFRDEEEAEQVVDVAEADAGQVAAAETGATEEAGSDEPANRADEPASVASSDADATVAAAAADPGDPAERLPGAGERVRNAERAADIPSAGDGGNGGHADGIASGEPDQRGLA